MSEQNELTLTTVDKSYIDLNYTPRKEFAEYRALTDKRIAEQDKTSALISQSLKTLCWLTGVGVAAIIAGFITQIFDLI